jgi:hypothetical protein
MALGAGTGGRVADRDARREARRFPITAQLLFREHGESAWRTGSTINVSRSGVLFRTAGTPLDPTHSLDFILTLPLDGETLAPHVRCTGHIVRVAPEVLANGDHAVAVAIDSYAMEGRHPV